MRICGTHVHTYRHVDATCNDMHTSLCTSAACVSVNPPLRKRFPAAHTLRETHTHTHVHTLTHTWGMRSHHISLMRHRHQQQEMMIKVYFHRFSILFDEFLHTFFGSRLDSRAIAATACVSQRATAAKRESETRAGERQ